MQDPTHDSSAAGASPKSLTADRRSPTAPGALALLVLCAARFMDAIDLSDVGVALPDPHSTLDRTAIQVPCVAPDRPL